ncbi:MAG: hypothetical protein BWX80_02406 [Candidatus Hydrogenedentes bacterium ADurb.Bin101]|nr:MAG: hypothetical protein BWX80_02406 [Candidatus Hydrogenedentes bacterium ADurb.Bin101]
MIFLKRMERYISDILAYHVTVKIWRLEIQKCPQGRCFRRFRIGKAFSCVHHDGRNKQVIGKRSGRTAPALQSLLADMPSYDSQQGQENHFEEKGREKL